MVASRRARRPRHGPRRKFQSPSLRGSGRFRSRAPAPRCGANCVSIPFIAGQWSLPSDEEVRAQLLRKRFNPLHCGAVVASRGQGEKRKHEGNRFQSPSLRGSGRFSRGRRREPVRLRVSIPFIAGQWSLPKKSVGMIHYTLRFQSPSLRGSGRFGTITYTLNPPTPRVSIPFIAGQWSLLPLTEIATHPPDGFNPLHCGAVVASSKTSSAHTRRKACFNPLHCGAVVASRHSRDGRDINRFGVSIPFIAGQWSLPSPTPKPGCWRTSFNPLHCGAVVASWNTYRAALDAAQVSIPFIAGQWSLHDHHQTGSRLGREVSIPFIAGQWSLPSGLCPH